MKYNIGDIVTVKLKIVGIAKDDGKYQCSYLDGSEETDTMFFDDTDIIDKKKL